MKKYFAIILGLALVISMAGCGKAAAEATAKSSGTETVVTTATGSTTAVTPAGEIKMDMNDAINEIGLVMYHPVDWTQIFDFQSPIVYGTSKITKNDQEMSLYYLVVNGYLNIDSSEYAALTLDSVHERGFTYITDQGLGSYVGTSLAGTETSSETVTVGGVDYLKVVGKSTKGYMQPNYIAYFGFYDNATLEMVHAPIAIVLFIASDDAKDISYGEDVLNACMASITPYGA